MQQINIFSEFVDYSTEIMRAQNSMQISLISDKLSRLNYRAGMFPEHFEQGKETVSNVLDRLTNMLEFRFNLVATQIEICQRAMNETNLN